MTDGNARRPNIILFMSDDVGWGDLGCYGGGENRGAPTPHLDRLAAEGLQFLSFYGQPSCTPGRAAAMTGRLPIRSGMTTVSFPGQGGGLPAGEWTVASVLKQAGYGTCQIGKWHLGEADYSMPTAHGFDEMHNTTLYHLNAYTYTDPTFNPDFPFDDAETMAMWGNVIGAVEGKAGEPWHEAEKLDAAKIPFIDEKSVSHAIDYLDAHAAGDAPFFLYLNTAKMHQPNLPHPDFVGKSMAKSKYLDSLVELDHHVGVVVDKVRELGIEQDTLVIWTTDNGAWQDVYPDCGYTPFRGTKGTDYEGGSRVPAIAWWPGTIAAGRRNSEIVGSLDFMATFASLAGLELPTEDREGQPTIFDSFDQTAVLDGHRAVDPRPLVLHDRDRADPRRGPPRQVEGDLEHPHGLEGRRRVHQRRARAVRPVAGPRRALRHLHDQLGREDLAGPADGSLGAQPAAHLPAIPEPRTADRRHQRCHVRRRGRPGPSSRCRR